MRYLLFSFIVFLFIGCSEDDSPDNTNPLPYQEQLNVAYGSHERQVYDVHLPANRDENTKVVFTVHGGGFIAGSKEEFQVQKDLFLQQGFAVVNMNYRLVDSTGVFSDPIDHHPSAVTMVEQQADLNAAVDHFKANATDWNISTDHMTMMGHSAGATLVLNYTHGDLNTDEDIKAVANVAGALNFAFQDESEVQLQDPRIIEIIYRLAGAEPTNENILSYMAISPFWVLSAGSSDRPTINIRPENDELDATDGANFVSFTNLLNDRNITNQYVVLEGAGHGLSEEGKWAEAIQLIADFFDEN